MLRQEQQKALRRYYESSRNSVGHGSKFRSFRHTGSYYLSVKNVPCENPANFLKLIADHQKNLKMIVSGSSTLETNKKGRGALCLFYYRQDLFLRVRRIFPDRCVVAVQYKTDDFLLRNELQSFFYVIRGSRSRLNYHNDVINKRHKSKRVGAA
jgi:hypothetical protein